MQKYCLICTRQAPAGDEATCPFCGEASWGFGDNGTHAFQLSDLDDKPAAKPARAKEPAPAEQAEEAASDATEAVSESTAPAPAEVASTPEAEQPADTAAPPARERSHEQRHGKNRRNRRR